MPVGHPGPPPEMPPHGSSDPESPSYNPDRAAWEDRVGPAEAQRIKSAWQAWAGQEGEYIKQQLGSGLDLNEVPTENPGETYRDAPEHGASQFAYWNSDAGKSELEFLRKQGLQYSIAGGHATWDPTVNAYRGERRNGVEILRDRNGNIIRDPGGSFRPDPLANAFGQGTAYGGAPPTTTPTNTPTGNAADRPYLNQPNQAYDRGWSRYLGHSVDPTKKRPVASGSPFGDIRQGGVTDPNNPIYGLPGRQTGYIPGLSPSQ